MSSKNETPRGKSVSLEELIALNDEIVSLSRAGVPLELGLKEVAADQPGTLGEISNVLSDRMSRGLSLPAALEAEGDRFPKVYRTIVEAGLRVGRLPAALESLSKFGWELVDLRRKVGMAMMYPIIVIALGYGLFVVFLLELATRIHDLYEMIGMDISGPLWLLGELGRTIAFWGWIPPILSVFLIGWWGVSNKAQLLNPTGPSRPLCWIPGINRIAKSHRVANFSDLLATMVEHEVPLSEGIILSAEATSDGAFVASAHEAANAVARGDSPGEPTSKQSAIPPFLRWLLTRTEHQGSLAKALRQAAGMYRRRANNHTAWLKLLFPIVTAVVVGGGATLLYTLTLFVPLIDLLNDMSKDVTY